MATLTTTAEVCSFAAGGSVSSPHSELGSHTSGPDDRPGHRSGRLIDKSTKEASTEEPTPKETAAEETTSEKASPKETTPKEPTRGEAPEESTEERAREAGEQPFVDLPGKVEIHKIRKRRAVPV